MLRHLFDDAPANLRGKVIGIYGILFTFNAAAWLWAIVAFRHYPLLLGTALLAYSFGLRHAVDADHIAAIDNVTRKLMQEGKRPVASASCFRWDTPPSWCWARPPSPRRLLPCSTAWTGRARWAA